MLIEALRRVIKRLHYPAEVMLVCVRWYMAYPLSLRHLEEMMAERGVAVDHSTIHRWAMKMLPVLAAVCRRRKLPVGKSWRMDERLRGFGEQEMEGLLSAMLDTGPSRTPLELRKYPQLCRTPAAGF